MANAMPTNINSLEVYAWQSMLVSIQLLMHQSLMIKMKQYFPTISKSTHACDRASI